MPRKALEGIKIADFTRIIVGPFTAKNLTAFGAEAIRIESLKSLDLYRGQGGEPDRGNHFTVWNTNKMSIRLDLSHPKGVEVAKRIAAWADIVIESFSGGAMERFGLGYQELKKVKPDIIMLSTCMQGQTGPFANHPGWGFQMVGLSGLTNITGWPDREPPSIGPYTDFIAPHFHVSVLLSALLYRRRTGKGMYIDLSQYETALHFMSPLILDYRVNNRVANRMGNRLDYAAPHGAYRCQDEYTWCSIGISTDKEWGDFCKVIGNPPWTKESRFSTVSARKENEKELDRLIEEWTATHTVEEIIAMMPPPGVQPMGAQPSAEPLVITANRLPTGAYQPGHSPHGAYCCKTEDRWCAIAVSTDEDWKNFCKVIGNPAWTKESRFSTLLLRKENEDELDKLVEEWTVNHLAQEVMTLMQEGGVAAGVVETGEDQLENDPQSKARNFYPELDHPVLGKHHPPSSPLALSKTPFEIKRAPLFGEHNEYILKDLLGYSYEEIAELAIEGVLE